MMNGRNRGHVLEKRYNFDRYSDLFNLDRDIMDLTRLSARLSITVGSHTTVLNVFCRTDTSKVYRTAISKGFEEI